MSSVLLTEESGVPGAVALIPTLGSLLLILLGDSQNRVSQLLSLPPFVGLGLISYSAYLWHQPLFAFTRHLMVYPPPHWVFGVLTCITLAVSYLSWRFIENPIRHSLWKNFSSKQIVGAGVLASLVLALFGSLHFASLGGKNASTWLFSNFSSDIEKNFKIASDQARELGGKLLDDGACTYHAEVESFDRNRFEQCFEKLGKASVIIGDSHSRDIYQALAPLRKGAFLVSMSKGGCRPAKPRDFCKNHYNQVSKALGSVREKLNRVIFTQSSKHLFVEQNGVTTDKQALELTIDYLKGLQTAGIPLEFWGPRQIPNLTKRQVFYSQCIDQEAYSKTTNSILAAALDKASAIDTQLAELSLASSLKYISTVSSLDFNWKQDLTDCNTLYWSNESHWSSTGEKRFGKRLMRLMGKDRDP
ncbi:MAG: SGNH hydrolase domain-containing protein, partial [Pseudomonadota bacterium]